MKDAKNKSPVGTPASNAKKIKIIEGGIIVPKPPPTHISPTDKCLS